ncbi:hypothetical protein [Saccharopolyspora sp. 5N708]|uniref:hypothetical protein n=1 Tax=Saccharopolyspora sp. 5N708 TaxID=3457424 RepID=UPI003FD3A3D0
MGDLVAPLVVLAIFGVVLIGLPLLAFRARRRRGGGVLGPFEEIWHPAAHRARIETEVQEQRLAPPMPSPDDL